MVINDLDLVGFTFGPDKADAVLIVDSYAVLSFSVAFEWFQPVSRRAVQVFKIRSGVKHYEFSVRSILNSIVLPFREIEVGS